MQDKPAVVLCDRGTCDPKAYVSRDQWQVILDQEGWNTNTLRDFRYDAVIHLVTAASGAEKFYSLDNKARYENLKEAKLSDEKTLRAYVGHPHHLIIDNSEVGFERKLSRVLNQLKKIIGLDYDKQFNKSFLLNNCNNHQIYPFNHSKTAKMISSIAYTRTNSNSKTTPWTCTSSKPKKRTPKSTSAKEETKILPIPILS